MGKGLATVDTTHALQEFPGGPGTWYSHGSPETGQPEAGRWAGSPQQPKVAPSPLPKCHLEARWADPGYGKGQKSSSSTDVLGSIQPDGVIKTDARPGQGCTALAVFRTQICLFFALTSGESSVFVPSAPAK